jgi:hypothetical protein
MVADKPLKELRSSQTPRQNVAAFLLSYCMLLMLSLHS